MESVEKLREWISDTEDRLEVNIHFTDGSTHPHTLNRVGREVDYIEVDGVRYERVRECEVVDNG